MLIFVSFFVFLDYFFIFALFFEKLGGADEKIVKSRLIYSVTPPLP